MKLGDIDIDALIAEAEEQAELDSVIGTAALADRILNARETPGAPLPWGWVNGLFDLRPGEVTIWAGESGSGKSLLLGQVIAWLLPLGQRALIASLEMRCEETLARMIAQCAGCKPSPEYIRRWCDWGEGRLWLYDQLDTVPSERVLAMARAVVRRFELHHVVIDSLVKCGVPQDGAGFLSAQTGFLDRLQHAAKHLGCHLHVVAHTRKPERGQGKPTKHDVRGASQITDLADNVVLVSRNRGKETAAAVPAELRSPEEAETMGQPDAYLQVAKQRHHAWEGTIGLDYLAECGQYIRHDGGRPIPWHGF